MPNLNLTNLPNLKSWLLSPAAGTPFTTNDDATLNRLISASSTQIMQYLARQTIFKNTVTNDVYTGNVNNSMLIQQWPVITLNSLYINNVLIPQAANNTTSGWLLQPWDGFSSGRPQQLSLNGYSFLPGSCYGEAYYGGGSPYNSGFTRNSGGYSGAQNVVLNYVVGYCVQGEATTIPATPFQYTALQQQGTWGQDDGHTIAGVAGVPVASAPTTGQYSVVNGLYTFAAADVGKSVVLNYSYVPFALEQCCIGLAAEFYKYKPRIGQKSQSVGGSETSSYDLSGIPDRIKTALAPYRSIISKR